MEEKEKILIENSNGESMEVELVTYLISEDNMTTYLVYTKGEKQGVEEDEIIYISKILDDSGILKLEEIVDDLEWSSVQQLLKKIANAN